MPKTELNFFGYRIVDLSTMKPAQGMTASFLYRGYEISFSTYHAAGSKVAIFHGDVHISDCPSVEAAIASVDEMRDWRSGANASERATARQRATHRH